MDNPWGSPWAAEDDPAPVLAAAAAVTSPALHAPSPDALRPSVFAVPALAEDDDGDWGGSLGDGGGWGTSTALEEDGGWGVGTAAASPSPEEDDGQATPALELELEPDDPAPAAPSPDASQEQHDAQEPAFDLADSSPVELTPVGRSPTRSPSPPSRAAAGASSPPSSAFVPPSSPPAFSPAPLSPPPPSPPAFPASDSFDDFAPFAGPPALGTAVDDDDPWGAGASFAPPEGEEDDGWGAVAAPVRRDAGGEDDTWRAEREAQEDHQRVDAQEEEDEWAQARRRAAIRAKRAPRDIVDRLREQWAELARAQYAPPRADKPVEVAPALAQAKERQTPSDTAVEATPEGGAEGSAQPEKGQEPAPAAEETSPSPSTEDAAQDAKVNVSPPPEAPPANAGVEQDVLKTEVDEYLGLKLDEIKNIADLLPTLLQPPESTSISYPSSATHAQFLSALRLSLRLSNSSSLLNTRRTRLPSATPAYASPSHAGDEWWDRSRLGEEEDRFEPVEASEEKRGWFGAWSRRSSSQAAPSLRSREGSADMVGSKPAVAGAVERPASFVAARPSTDRGPSPAPSTAPAAPSTQASPRPSLSLGSEISARPIAEDPAAPSPPQPTATPPPSAVSRFLNRFSRKPASQQAQEKDPKASLELSAGDFDFLAEADAASLAQGAANLSAGLDFLSGAAAPVISRGKQAALDDFLNSKPIAALPKPLAPPPAPSRSISSTLQAPQPKSAAPAPSSGLDDLSFLSFDAPLPPSAAAQPLLHVATVPHTSSRVDDEWDDFVASPARVDSPTVLNPPPSTEPTIPALVPPLAPSGSASKSPALALTPLVPSSASISVSPAPAVLSPSPSPLPPPTGPDPHADEDEFGDFDSGPSTPFSGAPPSNSDMFGAHDFDDFDSFASAPSPARPPPAFSSSLSSPGGAAPEPISKSPRHAQGAHASSWSMAASTPRSTGSPTPSPLRASSPTPSAPSQPPSGARAPAAAASIASMASLVTHARNVSQSSARGWSSSPAPAVTPLPAPLAPPPGAAKRSQSLFDAEDDDDVPLAMVRAASPALAPAVKPALPVQQAPLVSAPKPPPANPSTSAGGGGLSAADLDFFDGL